MSSHTTLPRVGFPPHLSLHSSCAVAWCTSCPATPTSIYHQGPRDAMGKVCHVQMRVCTHKQPPYRVSYTQEMPTDCSGSAVSSCRQAMLGALGAGSPGVGGQLERVRGLCRLHRGQARGCLRWWQGGRWARTFEHRRVHVLSPQTPRPQSARPAPRSSPPPARSFVYSRHFKAAVTPANSRQPRAPPHSPQIPYPKASSRCR